MTRPAAPGECPADALTGVRFWRADHDGRLRGAVTPAFWGRGPQHAQCAPFPGHRATHRAPGERCSCGFNAFHTGTDMDAYCRRTGLHGSVLGVVAGWGEVRVHQRGWRAQYAQVLAVAARTDDPVERTAATAAARRYQVPFVAREHLDTVAAEYGHRADPQVIPGLRDELVAAAGPHAAKALSVLLLAGGAAAPGRCGWWRPAAAVAALATSASTRRAGGQHPAGDVALAGAIATATVAVGAARAARRIVSSR